MFSTWPSLHASRWNTFSSLEQSLMNDFMYPTTSLNTIPIVTIDLTTTDDDEDTFFDDLPIRHTRRSRHQKPPQVVSEEKSKHVPAADKEVAKNETKTAKKTPTFSTYSLSNSILIDEKGQRLQTLRRRYEDGSGYLKAYHERRIGNKICKTYWSRPNKRSEGTQRQELENCTGKEFDTLWEETQFAKALENVKSASGCGCPTSCKCRGEDQSCPCTEQNPCSCCDNKQSIGEETQSAKTLENVKSASSGCGCPTSCKCRGEDQSCPCTEQNPCSCCENKPSSTEEPIAP